MKQQNCDFLFIFKFLHSVVIVVSVPVALLTSSTTETTASTTSAVGHPDNYGCVLDDNVFYADGAQVSVLQNPRIIVSLTTADLPMIWGGKKFGHDDCDESL